MSEPELFDAEYFRQFVPREGGVLERLEKEAVEDDVPIVGPLMGKMLWMLTKLIKAEKVLELGTATGYSAIWFANALRDSDGKLTTIEWDKNTAKQAEANIKEAGCADLVEILQGDASELLKTFEPDHFDFIFQDIEKEMYLDLLEPCVRVLRPGGLMLFDNTAFKTAGEFLSESLKHPELEGLHLFAFLPDHAPDFDGISIFIKK
jgi:predicted O-methyltransferase YrrM